MQLYQYRTSFGAGIAAYREWRHMYEYTARVKRSTLIDPGI